MSRLVIYGAGGFGRELVTAARNDSREIVFLSDTPVAAFSGIRIITLADLRPDDEIIISVSDPAVRRKIADRCPDQFGSLVSPTTIIGHEVEIGEGAVLCDNTMVTASAKIGKHFHCNIYSFVPHDCVIGDYVTFSPRVCCGGNVRIGDGVFVGSGATIRNGRPGYPITIGAGAVIGMGAVVTKDIPPGVTVVGNPARIMDVGHHGAVTTKSSGGRP